MNPRIGALVLTICLALGVTSQAGANPIINLGENFYANGLNNHQVVVGGINLQDDSTDTIPSHAYVWKAGTLTKLHEPDGATASDAYAVNEAGRIVGDAKVAGNSYQGEYWDDWAGAPQRVGPFDNSSGQDFTEAVGVTTSGKMVGTAIYASFAPVGFHASEEGVLTRVGAVDDGSTSVAAVTPDDTKMLVHTSGTDVDNYATSGWYLWPTNSDGARTKLDITPAIGENLGEGTVLQGQYSSDFASDGSVLGFQGSGLSKSFYVRTPDGNKKLVDGMLRYNGVNAKHQVVGQVTGEFMGNVVPNAAIWKPTPAGGTIVNLNSLIPSNSDYILLDALGINDNGDIVGMAARKSDGQTIGFLLPAGFVVDNIGDEPDSTPGDGACVTAQGFCTLRAAMQEVSAGSSTAPTSVSFNLPALATTISPQSALPAVTKPISIDGSTNPGGRVVLDGTQAGTGSVGLRLQGDGSILRGMKIANFDDAGVRINGSNMVIGGLATDSPPCAFPCNIIKDNKSSGVVVAGGGSIKNMIQGDQLIGNGRPAIDLGGDGRTKNDAVDADSGANGLRNFPIGVLSEKDPVSNVVKISGLDPIGDQSERIDIYAQSAVNTARGAEPTDYVGTTIVSETGAWKLDLPSGLPAADKFFSATLTDHNEGTSELSPICGDPDGDGNPDSDGDGLCDDWELHGIDADDDGTVDLPINDVAYGASPTHKDLYLELDAMNDGQSVEGPGQGAVDDVVNAFAAAQVENATGGSGVALHVNPTRPAIDDRLPEEDLNIEGESVGSLDYTRNGAPGNACDGASGSQADRAAPNCAARLAARALAFRWVLFANTYSEERGSSGFAAGLGGNELTVTLGQWPADGILFGGGGIGRCHTMLECRRIVDAGTLMHEFGHSLGLHHGGQDDVQYKPNYLSVMNYTFQDLARVHDRPLDYSRYALPALDEHALVAADGILGAVDPATRSDVTTRWPTTGYYTGVEDNCHWRIAPSGGPVSWSDDLVVTIASTVVHDEECKEGKTILKSTKDWPDLRYSFRDQPGALESPNAQGDSSLTTHEQTSDELLTHGVNSDADNNGVNDLADACREVAGSEFADANGNGFADVCDADLIRLKATPSQSNGSGSGGPAKDTTAPKLSKLTARPSVAHLARKHKQAKAAKLSFTSSEAATVTFTGEAASKGRMKGKRCVAGGKKGKSCVSYKKVSGNLRVDAKAGSNSVKFTGKLGTKKLRAGIYRLTAIAIDAAGNKSLPVTLTVSVR